MELSGPISSILTTSAVVLHWCIIVGLGLRIILKRRPTGVSLAWFLLITTVPFVGAIVYLFVGEVWLPHKRIKRYNASVKRLALASHLIEERWEMSSDELPPIPAMLNAHAHVPLGLSALGGNTFELFETAGSCLRAIAEDIDRAQRSVNMLFYIWHTQGDPELVAQALIRAAQRGVACRVMVDSAGSRDFARGAMARSLRKAGVVVVEAMPVGMFRFLFARIDIRNHRKIVTIDHEIAYTGSMNMVDPRYFHSHKNVGEWVDVMARVRGPAARVLDMIIAIDWAVESELQPRNLPESLIDSIQGAEPIEAAGDVVLQVLPSGPDQPPQLIHDMLLTLIYGAQRRLVITTPYFIPSEAMLTAITSAAHRGVEVTLVVPLRIDSVLVRHASKAYYEDLFASGVEIRAYKGGLLHAKTVTADDSVVMLGTVNMDKRSFWINFEISLFAYDAGIVENMRTLQESYIADSVRVDPEAWERRLIHQKVIQNTVQLLAPIL
ncbi:MAG: cardiolipin synthase [Phycisphaerales bacterium]